MQNKKDKLITKSLIDLTKAVSILLETAHVNNEYHENGHNCDISKLIGDLENDSNSLGNLINN
jgi:hypothetical protein